MPSSAGMIAISGDGDIEYSTGLGADSEIQAAVVGAQRNDRRNESRLFSLVDRKLLVLRIPSGSSDLYLIHDSREEDHLLNFVSTVDIAHKILNQVVSHLTVVDERARLRFISPTSASMLGLELHNVIGKAVEDVIPNTRLHEVVATGRSEFGRLEFNGKTRIVSRRPIIENGKVVGAIGQVLFKGPEQLHELSREIARLKSEVNFYQRELSVARTQAYGLQQIVGTSPAMLELKSQIARIAPLDVPVLLVGESGTGKELVAHAIHALSGRSSRPMVVVNAAALPMTLIESELFGYEPGAFTGAEKKGRKGKLETADESTLFLDEISDMPLDVQVKLLRVLQDKMIERIGSNRMRYAGFRLICAANRDLEVMVSEDKFRMDLYYRIRVITLRVPPLRDRVGDIPLLVDSFLEAYARRHQTAMLSVDPQAYDWLSKQVWPGNVRQLLHDVERAAIFCDGGVLRVEDFISPGLNAPVSERIVAPSQPGTMSAARESLELQLIKEALIRHKGNKSKVADELGISRSHLYKKLALLAEHPA